MHDQLKDFLSKIISIEFPDEREEFEEYADGFIQLFLREDCYQEAYSGAHNEFSAIELQTSVNFISLIIGTIRTFFVFKKEVKSGDSRFVHSALKRWESELVAAGLNSKKARKIPADYSDDLLNCLSYDK